MREYKQNNTLSIVAIVFAGLGTLLSLIPCIGFFGIGFAIIGLILGAIAYFKAKDNGDKTTLAITALFLSLLPILISAVWYFTFKSSVESIPDNVKVYASCDTLEMDYRTVEAEIASLESEFEKNENISVLKQMAKLTKLAIKSSNLQDQAMELGCDLVSSEVQDINRVESDIDTLSQ